MVRSTRRGARAVLTLGLALATAAPVAAAPPSRWEVTVALRVRSTNGGAVAIRVALPPSDATQRLGAVAVRARGLTQEIVADGAEPHVLLRGKLKGPRRVAVTYTVERQRSPEAMPVIAPLDAPPADLLPYLTPSPLFQSRSILARDFLETNVSPLLDAPGAPDLVRRVLQVTRERLVWAKDGESQGLDVIRSGRGKRIGIERAFTTFLRCARLPARLVEGLDLESKTRRKRAFWTEVWGQGRWWPLSASAGWVGRVPRAWIAVARDGQRLLRVEGAAKVTYSVQATPDEDAA